MYKKSNNNQLDNIEKGQPPPETTEFDINDYKKDKNTMGINIQFDSVTTNVQYKQIAVLTFTKILTTIDDNHHFTALVIDIVELQLYCEPNKSTK